VVEISVKVSFPVTGEESDGYGRELGERLSWWERPKSARQEQQRSIETSKNHKARVLQVTSTNGTASNAVGDSWGSRHQ
jgi:hypothetical protein